MSNSNAHRVCRRWASGAGSRLVRQLRRRVFLGRVLLALALSPADEGIPAHEIPFGVPGRPAWTGRPGSSSAVMPRVPAGPPRPAPRGWADWRWPTRPPSSCGAGPHPTHDQQESTPMTADRTAYHAPVRAG